MTWKEDILRKEETLQKEDKSREEGILQKEDMPGKKNVPRKGTRIPLSLHELLLLEARGEARGIEIGEAAGEARGIKSGEVTGENRMAKLMQRLLRNKNYGELEAVSNSREKRHDLYRKYGI